MIFLVFKYWIHLFTKLKAEQVQWRAKWLKEANEGRSIPSSRPSAKVFDVCHPILFPLIKDMLKILLTLLVSIAGAERSFSTLRLLKTYLRSTTGQTRLNGLALMFIHRDVKINNENVINGFANQKKRRLNKLML